MPLKPHPTDPMTEDERIRKCVELCVEAQMVDSKQYLRMMHDSTKRPWVGLSDEEAQWLYDNCRTPSNLIDMTEAKLKELNT